MAAQPTHPPIGCVILELVCIADPLTATSAFPLRLLRPTPASLLTGDAAVRRRRRRRPRGMTRRGRAEMGPRVRWNAVNTILVCLRVCVAMHARVFALHTVC
jgi:hypothetical protein